MGMFDKFKNDKNLTPEERRNNSNEKIKKMGITCYEKLPIIDSSNDIKLKSLDVVCKRAIACVLSASCASRIGQGEDNINTITLHLNLMKNYGILGSDLLPKEKAVLSNNYTKQDINDVAWSYETYWALIWSLDLITNKEMEDATHICRIERAVAILIETSKDYEFFKGMSKFRNIEKILDMLDLYYRYHWACVDKRINPETSIGKLNSEVVMERRKGLEWLISDEEDWNEISLDT